MTVSAITNYTFNKAAKTITFTDIANIDISRLLSVTDMTNGVQIYSYRINQYTYDSVSGNTVTLKYDTNNDLFSNSDKLYIEYITDNRTETIIPSTALTASGHTNAITNYGYSGVTFMINVSAVSGTTPSLEVKVQAKDELSGNFIDVPGAVVSGLTEAQLWRLTIYPGITATSNINVNNVLPRVYRISYTIGGTTPSVTFSISANYIN